MSNGARHGLGVLAGLILTPIIAAGLVYGTWRTLSGVQQFGATSNEYRIGLVSLAFTGIVAAVAVGSRLSPLGSLIPGLAFTGLGGLWAAAPEWAVKNTGDKIPDKLDAGYQSISGSGVLLMIGLLLLVASLFPARWRGQQDVQPSFEYEGSEPLSEPLSFESPPQYGEPTPQYGEPTPQYGRHASDPAPQFGRQAGADQQPGFSAAPDWGTPRHDPNQPRPPV